ncbi:MAG: TRAP transporter small permease [Verrucomicrobia bacterium]|nr:TRAP transporter small permease [Verrucomicrobiota bacterium]MDA1069631.1 TRAP transporter small permease [Verrucomicrobiota bacterium]
MNKVSANDSGESTLLRRIAAIDVALAQWVERVCVILLGLMVLTTTASIVTRFVIFNPLNFADPLAKYLMMWCAFLGVGLALRKAEHIAVEMLRDRLKGTPLILLEHLVDGVIFVFLGAVVFYGFGYALSGRESHDPFVFGVSMTIPYLSVPIGAGVALFQLALSSAIRVERRRGNKLPSVG